MTPGRTIRGAALLVFAGVLGADIIDRIAVSVGNRVITASDLDREIRITAFLDGGQLDFSPTAKRAAADRMVEQKLIQRELETSRYPLPAPSSIDPALADFKKKNFPSGQAYQAALANYGLTEKDVREKVLWQRTLLKFLELRFEPGIQVRDEEVEAYFKNVVAPAAEAAHPGQKPELDEYWDQIEEKLVGERANQEMTKWLEEARKRTDVVYHEEVLR